MSDTRYEHAAPAEAAPLLTGTVGPGSQSTATPLLCKSAVSASQQHVRRLLHPHRSCTTICRPHKQHSVNVQIATVGMVHADVNHIAVWSLLLFAGVPITAPKSRQFSLQKGYGGLVCTLG